MCIELASCVFNFKFFYVESQEGIAEPIDGILGLARSRPMILNSNEANEIGPLYVLALTSQSTIQQNTVSFYLQPAGSLSFVDFGSPSLSYIRDIEELTYINLLDDFFWSQFNQGIGIGSTSEEDVFAYNSVEQHSHYAKTIKNHSVYTIMDTGSNAIYFSALYYEVFIRKIFAYVQGQAWKMIDGIINTECYDFPPLYFMFDNKWVKVSASDYVVDFSKAQDRSLCILMIFPQNSAFHVFGLPLFMDYYTIHEMDAGRIGFAPHNASDKPMLLEAKQPKTLLDGTVLVEEVQDIHGTVESAEMWASVFSTALLLAILLYGYFAIFPWLKTSFLPDGSHKDAKVGRQILIGSYLLVAFTFCLFIMRPALVELINSSASKPLGSEDTTALDEQAQESPVGGLE